MSSKTSWAAVQCSGMVVAVTTCLALVGCGDGGGIAAAPAAESTTTTQTVTQSDIVLPSTVQVVTAR
ncbi:MAG: hypothetical protein V4739_11140 [Pseudomonadota bacterium]